ncbi:MAG: CBS domain-containing protein [Myxococcota bacterium]|jgi:CBS domain-containing protein
MYVRDVMTPEPITIMPSAPLEEALELMTRNGIHELPVVSGEQLDGIITERDLRGALGSSDHSPADLAREVQEVMTTDVQVLTTESSMAEACHMLISARISSLPVVDDAAQLVGIISVTDVLSEAARLFEASP